MRPTALSHNRRSLWNSFLAGLFHPDPLKFTGKPRAFRPRLESLEEREVPAVFLVTNTGNGTGSPYDGTLRAAILESNTTPGPNTIEFDIEPGGTQTISLTSSLPSIANTVTIDATTDPGWISTPYVVLDGSHLGFSNGLTINAPGCKIEGLVIQNFSNDGIGLYSSDNTVMGNTFQSCNNNGVEIANAVSGNVIGGATVRAGNRFFSDSNGILITENSTNNFVEGNTIGMSPDANGYHGNFQSGIRVDGGASNNTIGGISPGAANTISDNFGYGIILLGNDNLVQGNSLDSNEEGGVQLTGGASQIVGNSITNNIFGIIVYSTSGGVLIQGNDVTGDGYGITINNLYNASNIMIGGTSPGEGNTISGNQAAGVYVDGAYSINQQTGAVVYSNSNTTLEGNTIDQNGEGVELLGSNNTIGGTATGAGNTINSNTQDGVLVFSGNNNAIRQNSIYGNMGLGIDLNFNPTGAQPGNNGLIAPTLSSSAPFDPTTKSLTLALSIPNTSTATAYTLDFFASSTQNGTPQGQIYLGSGSITSKIGTSGSSTFPVKIKVSSPLFSSTATPMITATMTDPKGNTSQFSNAAHDPVMAAPAFESPRTAAFTVATPGSFTVAASGFPSPIFTLTGVLPKGLSFNRTTGLLSGTPAPGSSGIYVLGLTAGNGFGKAATQTLILTVKKLVTPVSIPDQVTISTPSKVTALGQNRFEAVFTLTESSTANLTGRIAIAGFTNLPAGVTFDSSTAAAFPRSKKITLEVVFTNTSSASLASLLAGFSPLIDEIIG